MIQLFCLRRAPWVRHHAVGRIVLAVTLLGACPRNTLGQFETPVPRWYPADSVTPISSPGDSTRVNPMHRLSTLVPLRSPVTALPAPNQPASLPGEKAKFAPEKLPAPHKDTDERSRKSTNKGQATTPLPASPNSAWHLAMLEAMALQHNPALQRAMASIDAAHGRALQAGLKPNPMAGLDYQQIGSRGQAEQFGATLQQEFVVRGKLRLNREVAFHDIERMQQELAIQRQRVLTDVRTAYVRLLKAQKQLELLQSLALVTEEARTISEKLLKAEEVSKTDLLQAEVEVQRIKLAQANAFNQQTAAWRELTAVIGRPDLPWRPMAGELHGPTAERNFAQTLAQLRASSPEIGRQLALVERARSQLRREQIEPYPNVTVQGLVNWQDNGIGGRSDSALTVSLPIPVWDRNQGAVQAAYQELVAADRQRHMLELELQQRLAEVDARFRNALQQTRQFETTILPRAVEVLNLTRQAYEIGELDFVSLLTAQRSYAQFQLDYLNALEALRIAEFEMEGLLLSGSLRPS